MKLSINAVLLQYLSQPDTVMTWWRPVPLHSEIPLAALIHMVTDLTSQSAVWGLSPAGHTEVTDGRPTPFVTWWRAQRQSNPLNNDSVFSFLTEWLSPPTHPPHSASPWQRREAETSVPFHRLSVIGEFCRHAETSGSLLLWLPFTTRWTMMQEDWDQWIIVVGIGWKLFITFNKIITCEKRKTQSRCTLSAD